MKARWIRNAPDAMSALYETQGGPLPRYVAAFAEQDGTMTFYEANADGGFKKANALKGSGHTRAANQALRLMGYMVLQDGMTLYPVGHEHAPRLDRKQALDRASEVSRDAEKRARAYFADACMMLLAGDAVAKFEELFTAGTYALDSSDSAAATRRAIGKATYDADCSKLIASVGAFTVADAKDRADRALSLLRRGGAYGKRRARRRPQLLAIGMESRRRRTKQHAKEMGEWAVGVCKRPVSDTGIARLSTNGTFTPGETIKYNADDSPLYLGKDRAFECLPVSTGGTGITNAKPGVYLDIVAANHKPTPPRPLWERALVAGSPDAPRILSDYRMIIGRGAEMFQFGNLDMALNDAVDRRAAALEVFKAWLQLHPGEQIENFIDNNWRASTVIRPEVLP